MKDDIVQLLTKIFSKIINPYLSKNDLSTTAAHLTEKNYCISQCNKQGTKIINKVQKPHLFNIIKGNC